MSTRSQENGDDDGDGLMGNPGSSEGRRSQAQDGGKEARGGAA